MRKIIPSKSYKPLREKSLQRVLTNYYQRIILNSTYKLLAQKMNKKQFLLCKKLFGRINHHQLLNEYVLHNVFAFYQTLIVKSN